MLVWITIRGAGNTRRSTRLERKEGSNALNKGAEDAAAAVGALEGRGARGGWDIYVIVGLSYHGRRQGACSWISHTTHRPQAS